MIPSFNRQRWILLFGDVVLILLATEISSWICTGQLFNVLEIHTGASVFTLLLYVVMLYIFDMYNIGRAFHSGDSAMRILAAVGATGIFSSAIFYLLPSWKYGRGILLIQIVLVWGLLTGWRWGQAQILSLEILNVFLRLKFSPSLNLNKIEHFSKVSQQHLTPVRSAGPTRRGKQRVKSKIRMKQLRHKLKSGKMDVLEVPIPDLKSGMILVRNLLCMRIGLVNDNDNC
jgi:FlaA1/EpsC-like NDP-sugar epimerase